jgi:hypothetical protein
MRMFMVFSFFSWAWGGRGGGGGGGGRHGKACFYVGECPMFQKYQ